MIMIVESIRQIWVKVRILAQECLRYIVQGCKKMYEAIDCDTSDEGGLVLNAFCHPFHCVVEFLHLKSEMCYSFL